MFICQHIKFCSRISVILLIFATAVLYYTSSKSTNASKALGVDKLPSENSDSTYTKTVIRTKFVQKYNKTSGANVKQLKEIKDDVLRFGKEKAEIKLAVVLCGERLNQTIVTLKSAVILSRSPLHFVIIADDNNKEKIRTKILDWPNKVLDNLSFEIHPIAFPGGSEGEEWRKLFKLCACQRLFLPTLLQHIDSLLYVDTDVLFLHPVEDIWKYFHEMNSSQIAGLSPEHEDFATGWYNRFARHPYYEPLGVNSGVMLMNLTRMRAFHWETYLQPILKEYKLKIVWGDQDIINVIFHFHPDKLYIFPCEWNYRPDHCMYSSVCKTAESNGVAVVHGNRGVFQNNKQPAFKAVYEVMSKYKIGTDLSTGLLQPMKQALEKTTNTNCGKLLSVFKKSLENSVMNKKIEER